MFQFPVIELVDRYTIARVKYGKTNGANLDELVFYQDEIDKLKIEYNCDSIIQDIAELEKIHEQIWSLEDDFKKCRVDGAPLDEIGRRALEIRDLNNHRVKFKNLIAEKLGDPIRDIKQDHLSENE
jgi:hypothetical protein